MFWKEIPQKFILDHYYSLLSKFDRHKVLPKAIQWQYTTRKAQGWWDKDKFSSVLLWAASFYL